MFRNILGTALTRLINAIITLVILWVNTNNLGREGLGTIGLIVLGITLILLLNNYIGGGALVYLASRREIFSILLPSYIWGVLISVSGAYILSLFNLIPGEYTYHVMALSVIFSLATVNFNILLGKEKITRFNIITVLQLTVILLTLCYFIYARNNNTVVSYVYALYAGYSLSFVLTMISILGFVRISGVKGVYDTVRHIIKYGKFIQTANVVQLLNYRLGYYIIEFFLGRAALGLYNVGVQLSEGVWLAGKSVAMVQYSRISNEDDPDYARKLTVNLFKFTLIITFLILLILVVIPGNVYGLVFGQDFGDIKIVIVSLAPGILAIALSMMFSHYFTGTGRPKYNMIGSLIGLVLTLVLGLIFIPEYGLVAAGITASFSYFVTMLYLFFMFRKISGALMSDFRFKKDDLRYFSSEIMTVFRRRSQRK